MDLSPRGLHVCLNSMGKIRVLVASDLQLVRSALGELLRTQDALEVLSADVDACQTLVQSYRAISPDVLILDMPTKSSALRLPASILTNDPAARIVLLTTIDDIAFVRSMFATGVLGYLLKTAAPSELFRAIEEVHRRRPFLDPRLRRSAPHHLLTVSSNSPQGGRHQNKLSRREVEVLRAIALGHTTKEIARDLGVSEKTVQTYRERIYTKLELHTRSDLVHYALAHGIGWDLDS